jgi:hypothetical protein
LKAIEHAGIRAYIPLRNFEDSHRVLGKQRFEYDVQADQYRCPNGAVLPFCKHDYTQQAYIYQDKEEICNGCALKAQCTTSDLGRQVKRNFDEEYQERVRAYEGTAAYQKALAKRRVWVEPLFGEAKQWHGLDRFRLRGLEKVNIEGLLIATGQNLKRLLRQWGWGRRPGSNGAAMAATTLLLFALSGWPLRCE